MRGTVKFFNNTKGLGKIVGEDGKQYFVHETSIEVHEGLRFLLPGTEVEFEGYLGEKGLAAKKGVKVIRETGVVRHVPDELGFAEEKVEIPLKVDTLGRIYVGTHTLVTTVEGKVERGQYTGAFRAYYVGTHSFRGFELTLPEATAETAFVLLDRNKTPRRITTDGHYDHTEVGSYLLKVEANGSVFVWNLGVRIQSGTHRWIVIERRFRCRYDLSECSEKSLLAQTPVSGEKKRDNDGFVSGILRGIEFLREAESEVPAAQA